MFKIQNVAIVSLILCSLLIAFSGSHPTSSSGGYTSAPGDGVCSQCHTDNNTSLDGDFTVTGIPVDIEANTTYTVDIQLTNPSGNASRGGFQILALDADNTQGGTWSNAGTGSVLKTVIGKTYLGHQGSQSFPASNELNWTADWTAPDEEDATFNFYAVSILANGGNGNQNDRFLQQQFDATIPDVAIPLTLSIDLVANATCANSSDGSATVIISGGEAPYDIIWENGETTETATMLPVGNTFAVVTDAAGFSAEAEIIINYILELEIDIVDLNNASCFGTPDGSISLSVPNGTEPINYEWSNGETGNTITNIFSGTYTVIATDANGCDATLDILITEPDELEVNQTMDMPSCNGDEDGFIILSVTGGISPFSFSWEDGSQNESNFNLTAGTYLTTITDFNECITVISTELTEPLALNLDSTIIEHPVCNGDTNGTITVTPMGGISGYDYSWSNGSTTQTISGLSEGEYMLTVTDSENCSQSETYTLLNQIELIISTSSTAESSPGASDGTATVEIISGGITPYEYEWSTGDTTATANNLISGAYNVTVTDANGCSVDGMAIVSSGDCSLSTVVDILPVTCNGDNNGSVLVTVENAIAPVSFLWSDGSIIGNRSNLAADTYSLIVFDNAGCSDTVMNIIISEPLELNAQISTTPTTTNITSDGEIVITAGGGTGPYNIKLLDANGEEVAVNETGIFSNIPSGIYGALVIDDNGCDLTIDFIEVTFVTSTSDLFETYGILTYPNPVTHQLTVSVKEFASNLDISLRTIKGKLIWSDKGKSRVISIDLSDHTPGLYLLSVADQKHTTTRKISILH
ncbi:T9SS type A sorting domain-containing protein [Saprospiraceae bacterium]|nr:T9SS type A sorting domain-containing protein [Saprospiraceae bacterium]